jgi:hypothetical protein
MLLDQAFLHRGEEVPIEAGVNEKYQDLRRSVPVLVDQDKSEHGS